MSTLMFYYCSVDLKIYVQFRPKNVPQKRLLTLKFSNSTRPPFFFNSTSNKVYFFEVKLLLVVVNYRFVTSRLNWSKYEIPKIPKVAFTVHIYKTLLSDEPA